MLLWGYSAIWGLKLALKHVDYQVNPSPFNVCEGFVDFPSWAPLDQWVPWLFFPDGDCSEISWQFLSFSMPQWLVLIFAAYLLVFVVVTIGNLVKGRCCN
ncbi:Disulfide bond formation protein B [compost metagenome]